MSRLAGGTDVANLVDGLFGSRRCLYKRLLPFSYFQQQQLYQQLTRRPCAWLVACGNALAELASQQFSRPISPHYLIFDAPPAKLEVQFDIQPEFPKEQCYRTLGDVSPVVQTLAQAQFDDHVKRVRLFVHPDLSRSNLDPDKIKDLLPVAIEMADAAFQAASLTSA